MANNAFSKCEQIIKNNKIQVIDLKALDLIGRLHHVSLPVYKDTLKKIVKEGVGFDGSSYGFRKVENSDMVLIPECNNNYNKCNYCNHNSSGDPYRRQDPHPRPVNESR